MPEKNFYALFVGCFIAYPSGSTVSFEGQTVFKCLKHCRLLSFLFTGIFDKNKNCFCLNSTQGLSKISDSNCNSEGFYDRHFKSQYYTSIYQYIGMWI